MMRFLFLVLTISFIFTGLVQAGELHDLVRARDNGGLLRALLKVGTVENFDVDERDERGSTALRLAVRAGDANAVKLLLSTGADVNDAGLNRQPVIVLAARCGNPRIIELLLEHHAVLYVHDLRTGQSPFEAAIERGNNAALHVLLEHVEEDRRYGIVPYPVAEAEVEHTDPLPAIEVAEQGDADDTASDPASLLLLFGPTATSCWGLPPL